MSALNVLCAQLTRDLFAIAKCLLKFIKFEFSNNVLPPEPPEICRKYEFNL